MASIKALQDGAHAVVVAAVDGVPDDTLIDGVDNIAEADNLAVLVVDYTNSDLYVRLPDGSYVSVALA